MHLGAWGHRVVIVVVCAWRQGMEALEILAVLSAFRLFRSWLRRGVVTVQNVDFLIAGIGHPLRRAAELRLRSGNRIPNDAVLRICGHGGRGGIN